MLATPEYGDDDDDVDDKIIDIIIIFIPISGPALTWMPQCVSLEMVEPTVFVTPRVRAPA